jgi:DNA polymerase
MPWSDRQQAILAALGLRVWAPPAEAPATAPAPTPADTARIERAAGPATPADAAPVPRPAATAARTAPARPAAAPPPEAAQAPAVSVPRPVVAGLDWAALREVVADCRACALCQSRTQTVFGIGHVHAHWLVVGEAPGEQEDLSGEPFVGAAGQLLDRMLAALKLTRATDGDAPAAQRVYIANTLKCRPPRNRTPTPAEMAQCEPYLLRQIELLQPRLILAMGRSAVQALLRSDEAIGRLRGRVHRYAGVPLVVTYHPAYLLRNLPDKARAWEDLCLAADVAGQAA